MSKFGFTLAGSILVAAAVAFSGCGTATDTSSSTSTTEADDPGMAGSQERESAQATDEAAGSDTREAEATAGAADVPEELAKFADAFAELSDADRTAAYKQKTCPVSGELLGSMGTPLKVSANGRAVFLCCGGCEKKFKDNPDEYLAKIPE